MNVKQSDPGRGSLRILFLVALCSLPLIACSVFGQSFPPPRGATSIAPPSQAHAELESIRDTVMHRSQTNEQQVFAPNKTAVLKGDSVRLEDDGQAWLRFADALIVKLYHKGRLEVTGLPDPGADSVSRVFLNAGAVFSESLSPQVLAEQRVRVQIETPWAIIDEVGTRFLVYYDTSSGPLRNYTWVVVKEGVVEVADKSGHWVLVEAGQQTWVKPGEAPASPIPATRDALDTWGLDFPRIEAISDGAERDSDFLTPPESSTPPAAASPEPIVPPIISPPDPQIVRFYADPENLIAGQETYLRWEVQAATSVVITPYPGDVTGFTEWVVQPLENTPFVLSAINASGVRTTSEVTVYVSPPVVAPSEPVIIDFRAKPSEVQGSTLIELCYETKNAFEVEISPDIGSVAKLGLPLEAGCAPVMLQVTPTDKLFMFTLTVYDQFRKSATSQSVEVRVLAPD